jgi:predicted DNA-binding protein
VVKDSKKTGHGSEQFLFRLPGGMRERLAKVAEREGRTMGAVIVVALAEYFENHDAAPPGSRGYRRSAEIEAALKDLEDRLDRKLAELTKKTDTDEIARLIKEKIK